MITECSENANIKKCKVSTENLNYNLKQYIKTISDTTFTYYLIIQYSEMINDNGKIVKCTPGINTNCNTYYASLGL